MKTTIDLPDDLVKKLKLRAVHEGRKFKDVAAELLRRGLAEEAAEDSREPVIGRDPLTGLPVIECPHRPPPEEQLTPEKIHEILLQQEVDWTLGSR